MNDSKQIASALAAPFAADEIRWKPQAVSGNRALAVPYVSARAIEDRLDAVLGIDNWRDEYSVLADGNVMCTLSLRLGGEWIGKTDVGSQSEQPDEGDRLKAGFSDALKRAAVKWSIARYLYTIPKQWADWDPQKKQFVRMPTLPASALPAKPPAPKPPATPPNGQPALAFDQRLLQFDAELAKRGLIEAGACVKHVRALCIKANFPPDAATWNQSQQQYALGIAREFEAKHRKGKVS